MALQKFLQSALDGNADEATILLNAYNEDKKTQAYQEANNIKMHCIRRAESTMPPIDLKGTVSSIKYHLQHRRRNEAIAEVKSLIGQLEQVKFVPQDQIYTSYPITGPKKGRFAEEWPLDCSSIISQAEEAP